MPRVAPDPRLQGVRHREHGSQRVRAFMVVITVSPGYNSDVSVSPSARAALLRRSSNAANESRWPVSRCRYRQLASWIASPDRRACLRSRAWASADNSGVSSTRMQAARSALSLLTARSRSAVVKAPSRSRRASAEAISITDKRLVAMRPAFSCRRTLALPVS